MKNEDYTLLKFGNENFPVVVIDDFSINADHLYNTGLKCNFTPGGRHYPGHRANTSAAYLATQDTLLQQVLKDVFGLKNGANVVECNYSIVTTHPTKLTPIQRIPHFDGTDPNNIAFLHYLCSEQAGGTSFYRHRETGFESITQDRLSQYDIALHADIKKYGLPAAQYFSNSNSMFERIGQVEAKFNRMVIYSGLHLHSGNIDQPEKIGKKITDARMTLNTFMRAR